MPCLDSTLRGSLDAALGATLAALEAANPEAIHRQLDALVSTLTSWRYRLPIETWAACVQQAVRRHPAMRLLLLDPFAARSFEKPRGYSGDAVLMDLIYHHASVGGALRVTPPTGRCVYSYTSNHALARAATARRDLLAAEVDRLAGQNGGHLEVLSIACGHLREAQMSQALVTGRVKRWLALDQDSESVAVVEREQAGGSVQAMVGGVRTLLKTAWRRRLGTFDFIYATGLYDYLSDRVAKCLTRTVFSMLKPAGRFWITNYLPGIAGVGYIEAVMDWWLIFRTAEQVELLAADLPPEQVAARRTFTEPNGNIVFLEVVRGA